MNIKTLGKRDRKDYHRKYYRENREKILSRRRENHRTTSKRYYRKNKKLVLARTKKWNKNHLEKIRYYSKIASYKRRATLKEAGSHSEEEWSELKEKNDYTCGRCENREPFESQIYRFLTRDHIKPLSKGGMNTIDNIQPLCLNCNSSKNNKI